MSGLGIEVLGYWLSTFIMETCKQANILSALYSRFKNGGHKAEECQIIINSRVISEPRRKQNDHFPK